MTDAPDPDVLEQSQVVEDLPEPEPPHLGNDVPEADALEQSQNVRQSATMRSSVSSGRSAARRSSQ